MKKKIEAEVEVPMTPNFIKAGGTFLPIAEFEDYELALIGELWTKALIAKAQKRRTP